MPDNKNSIVKQEALAKKRVQGIISSLKQRHRKYGVPIPEPWALVAIRRTITRAIMDHKPCGWCGAALNPKNISLDHCIPLSRGGAGAWPSNFRIICRRCNKLKGMLNDVEFAAYRRFADKLAPVARKNIEIRLLTGAYTYASKKKTKAGSVSNMQSAINII